MQIEIERKFKSSNLTRIRQNLKNFGAVLIKSDLTQDIYFCVPEKKKNTRYLRVRIKNKNSDGTLAYHEVISDLKTKEWETDVADAKITIATLQKLGFKLDIKVIKDREEYHLKSSSILLDKVRGLGSFVEVEAKNKKEFDQIVEKLNLKEKDIISGAGYPDLLKEKYAKRFKQ